MLDILTIIGLIIGITLIVVAKKENQPKYLKKVGMIIILACIAINIPSFISGFIDGYTSVASAL